MSILIKRAKILGSGNSITDENKLTDIFIHEEKISAIGNFADKNADVVLDAQGAYLSPGFIDINTDSDHYLTIFDHPSQEDFLRQGVTTIVGGMCGSSLAPLLYGSLESVQKWGDISKVNIDWKTMAELLHSLDQRPLAVNFATLVGHSTIRRALVGTNIRDLTKNELSIFGATLKNALHEGAFGLSTGLGYIHGAKTPYPELKFLADIVRDNKGIYATHLRKNEEGIGDAVAETIKLAKESGVPTIISHFMPIIGSEKYYSDALQKIESLPKNLSLRFDMHPTDTSALALYTFLPTWAQNGGRGKMLMNLKDNWLRQRIVREMSTVRAEECIIAQAPGNDFLVGKSIANIAKFYNAKSNEEALVRLMITTGLKATILYKNINTELAKKAIMSDRSFISTNSASFPDSGKIVKPERALRTFTAFIEMAIGEKLKSLEKAVEKITLEPVTMLGIPGRGKIKEGYSADIVLFSITDGGGEKKKNVEIKSVVVNGKLVLRDGVFAGNLPGKNLRHALLQ